MAFPNNSELDGDSPLHNRGSRAEHVAWCKERALEYVERGELPEAMASMASDLNKHPETPGHMGCELGMMLMVNGHLKTKEEMRKWIEGFK
jgi:hypothetical protein